MDYYFRSQLPILSFDKDPKTVGLEAIRDVICEKPCNVIFIEIDGKLAGIISRGDVIRAKEAGLKKVPINRNYTFLEGWNPMKARDIFYRKFTIREIPVIDESGSLIGMCSASDDLLYLEYSDPWKGNRYAPAFLKALKKIRFVRAPEGDTRRETVISRWIREFEKYGVECELIGLREIVEKQRESTTILVPDFEIFNGGALLVQSLDNAGQFNTDIVHTMRSYESTMSEHAYDELIGKFADAGIKVYNMFFTEDESTPGRKRLWDGMREWRKKPGAKELRPFVMPSCAQAFYGDLNVGDYAKKVGQLYFEMDINSIYSRLRDTEGPYINIKNGERLTIDQPETADRTIWFFGPCFLIGGYVEDKYTIESLLQQRLNKEGYSCRVVNCGCYETPYQRMVHMSTTPMKPGDIIVMHMANRTFEHTEPIELMEILDRNDVPAEWLLDLPVHCNHKVNMLYADELYERMTKDGVLTSKVTPETQGTMVSRELAVNSLFLDLHFDDFHPQKGQIVGTVGMHGNPFTLGHRYLIETASKQVDQLFVLIIEDDLGMFSFAERYAMTVEGTKDLPNVRVVPAGPFQATRNVFQAYFVRINPADMRETAEVDTLIYTEIIAPRLGVTKRFLGDERHNPKMQFFNEYMKETLPKYGIEVVELKRASVDGHSISASVARDAAVKGDRATLLQNVPESTVKFFLGPDA